FSSRRRHTRFSRDWSSDVCSSDLSAPQHRTATGGLVRREMDGGPMTTTYSVTVTRDEDVWLAEATTRDGRPVTVLDFDDFDDLRSEERRVGKERRGRGWRGQERRE